MLWSDRLLRKRRYREACERLSRLRGAQSVLVVCHGNVCRSPYLEAVLRASLPTAEVASAGLSLSNQAVPEFSLEVGRARGVDLSAHRSRSLVAAEARRADVIIVMDANQARYLTQYLALSPRHVFIAGDLDPEFAGSRGIEDPFQRGKDVFVATYDRLDRVAETVVRCLRRRERRVGARG